jgi:hypothetical protein
LSELSADKPLSRTVDFDVVAYISTAHHCATAGFSSDSIVDRPQIIRPARKQMELLRRRVPITVV